MCICDVNDKYLVRHGEFPTAVLFANPNKHQLIAHLRLSKAWGTPISHWSRLPQAQEETERQKERLT